MDVKDKVIVITGGASGIGAAMTRKFADCGARSLVVADMNGDLAKQVANEVGGHAFTVDVGSESDIQHIIDETENRIGQIDLFCSNAGISVGGLIDTPEEAWEKVMQVNTMSHVYAARHLVPRMIKRGGGYLFSTSSAAGLLTSVGSVTYAVSKHAAVALAEWISITYGDSGIKVTVLCPQAVRTPMTANGAGTAAVDGMLEAEEVADAVLDAIEKERFFVLPHQEVKEYMIRKAADPDRWLRGMRRLRKQYVVNPPK